MRLFLASQNFGNHVDELLKLVGNGRNAVLIANAADYKPTKAERDQRVADEFERLEDIDFTVRELDLRTVSQEEIRDMLEWGDLVWVRGGNYIDLLYKMNSSGFSTLFKQYLENDEIAYGGYSAGAYVVTDVRKTLLDHEEEYETDNEDYLPLKLVDFALLVHWQNRSEQDYRNKRHQKAHKSGIKHFCLNDSDVVVVDGKHVELLT